MNKEAYEKLVKENLDWLLRQERTLEREHIICIVENAVRLYELEDENEKLKKEVEILKGRNNLLRDTYNNFQEALIHTQGLLEVTKATLGHYKEEERQRENKNEN